MITIAIPCYEQKGKGAGYLTVLLTSILRQRYDGAKFIVISDNATDDSIKKVCDVFAEALTIHYFKNAIPGNAADNINNVLDLCETDKIKLMMMDDIFLDPYALQQFSDALNFNSWAISNSKHINDKGTITGQRIATYNPQNFETNNVGMPSVIAFRRNDIRFDNRLKTFCDLYFYKQLYDLYGRPSVLPEFNIGQRFHSASLSRNQPASHAKDRNLLLSEEKIRVKQPKVVVAVVVYDRIFNIDRWINLWDQCDTDGAELVIIHNCDTDYDFNYTLKNARAFAKVIGRKSSGYDIGAFQDVCRKRLPGFPEYDYLLWCTDDTIPMRKDFIRPFVDSMTARVGITCMQISNEVARHVRTTGFCIRRELAEGLAFPADPVTTRQQCWQFEHRGGKRTLLGQTEALGFKAVQVAPLETSPLYDMGFWYRNAEALAQAAEKDRMAEHEQIFKIASNEISG